MRRVRALAWALRSMPRFPRKKPTEHFVPSSIMANNRLSRRRSSPVARFGSRSTIVTEVRRRHSSISPKTKQGSNGPLPKRHKFRKPKLQREIYILGYGTKRQIKSSRKAFDLFKAVNPYGNVPKEHAVPTLAIIWRSPTAQK
jgi:hypothetical protein